MKVGFCEEGGDFFCTFNGLLNFLESMCIGNWDRLSLLALNLDIESRASKQQPL